MAAVEFQTVYDLGQIGYAWSPFLITGLILSAVGFVMVFFPRLLSAITLGLMDVSKSRFFAWFYFLFAVLWTIATSTMSYSTHTHLLKRLQSGNYQVAEGPVENFDPMPPEGHKNESFDVAGQHFEYSDFSISGGFNNAASHGGPIRPGLYVRISHVDGTIVRLEIRRSTPPIR